MSRPKPFLHFKSSISGSIRALKSSSSPGRPSSLAYRFAATAPRKPGTSPHARQSQRGKSQERLQSKLQPQQQQQKQQQQQQPVQQVQQEESRPATAAEEEEEEGTMVKMAASASRMAFAADARHAKAMSSRPAGDPTTEHLSRVAARARSTTAAASVRRTQSAKSKRSVSRGSSSGGHSVKKEGGGTTTKLVEFGPIRFMAKESTKVKLVRQDSQRPGLRAMLYGLTLKMEREEKLQKKLLRKRASEFI
ncbi:hypothetical protein GPALN_012419 [Globodera pallida]|nr:hypothetical protein GPALN_012419 [Globodera pallida]